MSEWTGPAEGDLLADGVTLRAPVPAERWPYGPPSFHETGCTLHAGGLFCDCAASAADDAEWGEGNWPTVFQAGSAISEATARELTAEGEAAGAEYMEAVRRMWNVPQK